MNEPVTWNVGVTLAELEKRAIYAALRHFGGNKEAVARALDVSTKTIYNKIELYEGKKSDGVSSEAGLRVEQTPKDGRPERAVPVQEREEVQGLSPISSSTRSAKQEAPRAASTGRGR